MQTHDYIHRYRGYWSDGGKCSIRVYREAEQDTIVICSQLPENKNTSVTNLAEYLAAEVIKKYGMATPLTWIEHCPEHEGGIGKYSLVRFSSWKRREVRLGGVWRCRVGSPNWSRLRPEEVEELLNQQVRGRVLTSRSRYRSPIVGSKHGEVPSHLLGITGCHCSFLLGP